MNYALLIDRKATGLTDEIIKDLVLQNFPSKVLTYSYPAKPNLIWCLFFKGKANSLL